MKIFFKKAYDTPEILEDDFNIPSLREDLEKTRQALNAAYIGFNNAVDPDMIDCYIYEINALQKRYKHLSDLYVAETAPIAEHCNTTTVTRAPVAALLK